MRHETTKAMRVLCTVGLWILSLSWCAAAAATEPKSCWWSWYPSLKPCPCCPDDYCAKVLPCVAPVRDHGPDDYCPKPLPGVCPVKCCGKDDYCPKPCPSVPRCYYPPWMVCVPPPGCDPGPQHR